MEMPINPIRVPCKANRMVRNLTARVVERKGFWTAVCFCVAGAGTAGCLTQSRPVSSASADNLDLNVRCAISPLPTDLSKPRAAVLVAEVECNALITGRPLELARYVREALIEVLASSGNFEVAHSGGAARYLIEVSISSFERGISTRENESSADLVYAASRQQEQRAGAVELEVAVTDMADRRLVTGFSTGSQTKDITLTKRAGLLGFNHIGLAYERRADAEVLSEAARKVGMQLWNRLISPPAPSSNVSSSSIPQAKN